MGILTSSMKHKVEEIDYGTKCLDCVFSFTYTYYPEEKEVRYYSDGSGHPGSPAEIVIEEIEVDQVFDEEESIEITDKLERFMLDWFSDNIDLMEEVVGNKLADDYQDDLADKYEAYRSKYE